MGARLSPEVVIAGGGWHPSHARVVLIEEVGNAALVIVDGNGDGSELELEHWVRSGGEWRCGISSGLGHLGTTGSWSSGWTDGTGYAVGASPPGATVRVEWRDEVREVTANSDGLWLAAFPDKLAPDSEGGPSGGSQSDRPRIVDVD